MDGHEFSHAELERLLSGTVGKTPGEIDVAGVLSGKASNKGSAGAVFEQSVLGYPADSRQAPDLIVDGVPVELKVTGLLVSSKSPRGWRAKEPMSITAVSPQRICGEEFFTSTFWHKAERLLVVYYLYQKPGEGVRFARWATFEVKGFEFHVWSEIDVARLKSDWELVRGFVRNALELGKEEWLPRLSTDVNPMLLYLDTAPKYPHPPRFRLKNSVVTAMAEACFAQSDTDVLSIRSMSELERKLDAISERVNGLPLREIAGIAGVPALSRSEGKTPKSSVERVMTALITGKSTKMNAVPLFKKAGIEFKSVVITKSGARTEDMKLEPSIDFEELCNPEATFSDSAFGSKFIDSSIICAVFQETGTGCDLADTRFLGFARIWLGEFEEDAHRLWDRMRELIFTNTLVDVPVLDNQGKQRLTPKTGLPMSAPNWPKSSDSAVFVRGTGADAHDKTVVVNGVRMYRQNVWVRGRAIVSRIRL